VPPDFHIARETSDTRSQSPLFIIDSSTTVQNKIEIGGD